jgi:hypothetical protein
MAEYSDASVRVENASDVVFDGVIVGFLYEQGNYREYGRIEPHSVSAYRTFRHAYSYGHITVQTGGRTLTLQPIDWVGELPLSPGRYTYRVTVGTGLDGHPDLNVEFVTDRSLGGLVPSIILAVLAISSGLIVRYVVVSARKNDS